MCVDDQCIDVRIDNIEQISFKGIKTIATNYTLLSWFNVVTLYSQIKIFTLCVSVMPSIT